MENHFELAELEKLAGLIRTRNSVDGEIAKIIGRPALAGHVGEFIASRIFGIELHHSATAKGSDGAFIRGTLVGKTVNIKWYAKRENILDINPKEVPDYYLVLAGPKTPAATSKGTSRPLAIESVFLFEAESLFARLQQQGVKIGIATSVKSTSWAEAEVFPRSKGPMELDEEQRTSLKLFAPEEVE